MIIARWFTRVWAIAIFTALTNVANVAFAAEPLRVLPDAPERYTVVKGDTLWAISGKYLQTPWRWPELWQMNRDQIRNPHWIYPGDVLVLDLSGANPTLRLLKRETLSDVVKLSPKVRSQANALEAIPSIPANSIEPFLSQPLVVEEGYLERTPRIIATPENRVMVGIGETAYVSGFAADANRVGTSFQIFRQDRALLDPDTKDKNGKPLVLGYEATYLGEAAITRIGQPATIEITKSLREIAVGDRLLPTPKAIFNQYNPHAPEQQINAKIISTYGSVSEVGPQAIIALNKGTRDSVELGHVLALYSGDRNTVRAGSLLSSDKSGTGKAVVELPAERYGIVFIFRVFEKVSYALVMQTNRPVKMGDLAQNP